MVRTFFHQRTMAYVPPLQQQKWKKLDFKSKNLKTRFRSTDVKKDNYWPNLTHLYQSIRSFNTLQYCKLWPSKFIGTMRLPKHFITLSFLGNRLIFFLGTPFTFMFIGNIVIQFYVFCFSFFWESTANYHQQII